MIYFYKKSVMCERCGNLECAELDRMGARDTGDHHDYPQGPFPAEKARRDRCASCRRLLKARVAALAGEAT